jgi:hypothetical protein
MKSKKVYEYVIVKNDWFGELDKNTRLYYDFDKQGYVYHYEREDSGKSERYESKSYSSHDYFMSAELADINIRKDQLIPGPEIGELEFEPELKLT